MALPNSAIAGTAPAYVSYLELYQDPRTDGLNGDYAAIMCEYAAPLVDAAPPATIASRVTACAHDIATCMPCSATPSTVKRLPAFTALRRTISACPRPAHGAGNINTVDFPNDAFHLTGGAGNGADLFCAPQLMILDTAFAEGPSVQNVGLFKDDDIGTDVLRTRCFIYIPVKYAHIILEQRLTPRQAWERLGGAILAENAAGACAALIE
jgi:hypothetical protein